MKVPDVAVFWLAAAILVVVINAQDNTFTFLKEGAHVQYSPPWAGQAEHVYSFKFRTLNPHALLMYETLTAGGEEYSLIVGLKNGELFVRHQYGGEVKNVKCGKGLNHDKYHDVYIKYDEKQINIDVDGLTTAVLDLQDKGTIGFDKSVIVYMGGAPDSIREELEPAYVQFVGCMDEIKFNVIEEESGETSLQAITYLSAHESKSGCLNMCDGKNMCKNKGECVNLYVNISCDCFGTGYEGDMCNQKPVTEITLRGYDYLTYQLYQQGDAVHTITNRISLLFKTKKDNSVLFYGSGEQPQKNYIAAILADCKVNFYVDFGDSPMDVVIGKDLCDDSWHNLTVFHKGENVEVILDDKTDSITTKGRHHHLHLNPMFNIGGGEAPIIQLSRITNFNGCIKDIYYNHDSLLYKLKKKKTDVQLVGAADPAFKCQAVAPMPLTFLNMSASVVIQSPKREEISFTLQFKTYEKNALILFSTFTNRKDGKSSLGKYEVRLYHGGVFFAIQPNITDKVTQKGMKVDGEVNDAQWHTVYVTFKNGTGKMRVDNKNEDQMQNDMRNFTTDPVVFLGYTPTQNAGFAGCMRDIQIQSQQVVPTQVIEDESTKHVVLNDCAYKDFCKEDNPCEHKTPCISDYLSFKCNCSGTGYAGKTCHFSTLAPSCDYYYQAGEDRTGVWRIDVDGSGPMNASYVYCHMKGAHAITQVDNNLHNETVIRGPEEKNLTWAIDYREFCEGRLKTMVKNEVCSQKMIYKCLKAPLSMDSHTWFRAAGNFQPFYSFATNIIGCPCALNGTCAGGGDVKCNCDSNSDMRLVDQGIQRTDANLPIVKMTVIQHKVEMNSEGKMTIDPLMCAGPKMWQKNNTITITQEKETLSLPTWDGKNLSFSFRTTNSSGVLLFQAPNFKEVSQWSQYFILSMKSERELLIQYNEGGKAADFTVSSSQKLNDGNWQYTWIEIFKDEIQVKINSADGIVHQIKGGKTVGLFQGPLYLSGYPTSEDVFKPKLGNTIGCFRWLQLDGKLIDLVNITKTRADMAIKVGCEPSCNPVNPCQNGAKCNELWGAYTCKCLNEHAHSGKHCEINVNDDPTMWLETSTHIHKLYNKDNKPPGDIFTANIMISFRTYKPQALIFYANDHLNNFIQLHTDDKENIIFTYNSARKIVQGAINVKGYGYGMWTQIVVKRTATSTRFTVNNETVTINYPISKLVTYSQNPWDSGAELVNPGRGPMVSAEYMQLFVGDVKDGMSSILTGFVGCMAGVTFGEYELKLWEEKDNSIFKGCDTTCIPSPCNKGECIEKWGQSLYECECRSTSYAGSHCDQDIGGHFNGEYYVSYDLNPGQIEYTTQKESLIFTFSTVQKPVNNSRSRVMAFINSIEDDFVMITQEADGSMKLRLNLGSGTIPFTIAGNYADGKRHLVQYKRNGRSVHFQVDKKTETDDQVTSTSYELNSLSSLQVGGMLMNDPRFPDSQYESYYGCLSNLLFDPMDSTKDLLRPLESVQGYDDEADPYVEVVGPGTFVPRKCAAAAWLLEPTTMAPIPSDKYTYPPGFVIGNISTEEFTFIHPTSVAPSTAGTTVAIIIIVILLVIVVICIAVYAYKSNQKAKQRKQQQTKDQTQDEQERQAMLKQKAAQKQGDVNSNIRIENERDTDPEDGIEMKPLMKAESDNTMLTPKPNDQKQAPFGKLQPSREMEELRTPSYCSNQPEKGILGIPVDPNANVYDDAHPVTSKQNAAGEQQLSDSSRTLSSTSSSSSHDETKPVIHRVDVEDDQDPPEDLEWDPTDSTELLNRSGLPGESVRYGDPGSEYKENHFDEDKGSDSDDDFYSAKDGRLSPIHEELKSAGIAIAAPLATLDEFRYPIADSVRNSMVDP